MSFEIGPLPRFQPSLQPPARPAAAGGFDAVLARADRAQVSVPASPPPEVQDAVGVAADRAEALARDNRELHFRVDEETNRVVIEVRDLDGTVIRTIPPSQALEVMGGASL
jgi:flagellar protein FlaG